jgi:NADH-quinone oxidoreductase subunit A
MGTATVSRGRASAGIFWFAVACGCAEGTGRVEHLDQLFGNYVAVLLSTAFGFILVLTSLIGSRLLAPFSQEREKGTSYECGMLPIRRAQTNVGMRFYLYAIMFIIFDVEAVFIFPWALSFVAIGPMAYYEMVLFVAILAAGLAYAWKKGALKWQ